MTEQVTFGAAAARALKAAGVEVVSGGGVLWSHLPVCCPHDGSSCAPFRLADPDAELTEEQAEAVCEAQEGLVVQYPVNLDCWKVSDGEWLVFSADDVWRTPVGYPPGHVDRLSRTFRLVPDPSNVDASPIDEELLHEQLRVIEQSYESIREIAARAAAESRVAAEQREPETLTDGQMLDRCLAVEPRTTRLLSEAVLHAEAGGVVESFCDDGSRYAELFRMRDGVWEFRRKDGGEWNRDGGRWAITTDLEYALHPSSYPDDAPEKVEPKKGADFRRWLVETGRVGVDEDGDRTRWSVDSLRYVYWIDDVWVAYSGPDDNDTGLPESGTWEPER